MDEFSWDESECIVVKSVQGVAVYRNKDGDVVIRQEAGPLNDEDSFVLIPVANIDALIRGLKAVKAGK